MNYSKILEKFGGNVTDSNKRTYPKIPTKSWFALRKKWQNAIPRGEVNASYLASLLEMDTQSAQSNVLRGLKIVDLVSEDGKPTELAMRWRMDDDYPAVCREIVERIYPHELLDLYPNTPEERQKVKEWFQKTTQSGIVAAQMYSAFYNVLCEADPAKIKQETRKDKANTTKKSVKNNKQLEGNNSGSAPSQKAYPKEEMVDDSSSQIQDETNSKMSKTISKNGMTLHIDLQIHISPESTEAQIDTIFSSIAKYIYDKS